MRYKNSKTGYIFDTECEIKGQDWVKLDPDPDTAEALGEPVEETEKTSKKKAAKKDE